MPLTKPTYTVAEYLDREEDSLDKHEYRDGEILLMAGASPNHGLIAANTIRAFGNRLTGKPCRIYDSSVRVRIPRTVLYTYPDATVFCGELRTDPNDAKGETATNPRVIIEVLSPSTEAYDRGEKFTRYRMLDSMEEYLLISQTNASVESFYRQPDGTWLLTPVAGLEASVRLRSLGMEIPLAEIYSDVQFPPEPQAPVQEAGK